MWLAGGAVGVALIHMNVMTTPVTETSDESACSDVLLVQPSSAAVERVFSMLKASF